jgi:hypothetical protein
MGNPHNQIYRFHQTSGKNVPQKMVNYLQVISNSGFDQYIFLDQNSLPQSIVRYGERPLASREILVLC